MVVKIFRHGISLWQFLRMFSPFGEIAFLCVSQMPNPVVGCYRTWLRREVRRLSDNLSQLISGSALFQPVTHALPRTEARQFN